MRINDDLISSVVFLCTRLDPPRPEYEVDDPRQFFYRGTAFFVAVPSKVRQDFGYPYLITARHNVQLASDSDLYVRLNTQDGGAQFDVLPPGWRFPEDPSIDVAVLPIAKSHQLYAYKEMPIDLCAQDDFIFDHGIGIGDEIAIVGLFTNRTGLRRNIPIYRSGVIAAMPMEPIDDRKTGQQFKAYLIECRSTGGLSGSPVIAIVDHDRDLSIVQSKIKMKVIGVVRGHWEHQPDFIAPQTDREAMNVGIAMVTPIQHALALIYGEEVAHVRTLNEEQLRRGASPDVFTIGTAVVRKLG
jgi:hypothetical protein